MRAHEDPDPDDPDRARQAKARAVVTQALLRAAEDLQLGAKELGVILGLSPATVYRLSGGQRLVELDQKEGELALILLRIYRSLAALLGGDLASERQWLRSENHHLGGVPLELCKSVSGLAQVANYLDAMRGKV